MPQNDLFEPTLVQKTADSMYADVAVVTITTRNYLHRARALFESAKTLIPGARRIACCADSLGNLVDTAAEDYQVVEAGSLSLPRYSQLVLALNATALCCALKPHAVTYALQQPGIQRVLYLDNDIGLYRTPFEILDALAQHSFILTPHHLAPLPEGANPNELLLNPYGTFNAGLFAVRQCTEAMDFIHWWGRWLLDPRHLNPFCGYDQTWLNYVPVYCPSSKILTDPSYNVAFWNLVERDLRQEGELFLCGTSPLTIFHFSHFDETKPTELAVPNNICNHPPTEATRSLGVQIAAFWASHGRVQCLAWGYGHSGWHDGTPITELERERITQLWDELPPTTNLLSNDFRIKYPHLFQAIRSDLNLKGSRVLMAWHRLIARVLDITPRRMLRRLRNTVAGH
jgi:hypothetical protein